MAIGPFYPPQIILTIRLVVMVSAWAAAILLLLHESFHISTSAGADIEHPRRARRLRGQHEAANQTAIDQSHRSLFAGIQIHLERTIYKLPYAIERNLMDWNEVPDEGSKGLPIFWHVLKSGGTTIKLMYAQCYHLVEACETGAMLDNQLRGQEQSPQQPDVEGQQQGEHPSPWEWLQQQQQLQQQAQLNDPGNRQGRRRLDSENDELRVVTSGDGRRYVDVDVTTPEGILEASQRGFASSRLADVAFSPLLLESAESLLRADTHRGRMFAVFRHPVERVVSIFYYLQRATWEPTYSPEYATWTVDDYARDPHCESNWMVRTLTGKMTGPLAGDDVMVAQEVLRRKCLVGLIDRMEESVERFHRYFGFGDDYALRCSRDQFTGKGLAAANSHSHPGLDRKSETWEILERKNGLDIRLFAYAQKLFEEQGSWLKKENLI